MELLNLNQISENQRHVLPIGSNQSVLKQKSQVVDGSFQQRIVKELENHSAVVHDLARQATFGSSQGNHNTQAITSTQGMLSPTNLLRSNPRHLDLQGRMGPLMQQPEATFQKKLLVALEGVNAEQMKASDLAKQMIIDPESVDAHDLTIAAAKARMSLDLTKGLVDRALQAYREIMNMR